jgi:hypothetical protein
MVALESPDTLAWPQLFAQTLTDGALLPFRYDFVTLNVVFGQPSAVGALGSDEIGRVMQLYRLGYVQVDRSSSVTPGWVSVDPPGGTQFWICAWLTPTSTDLEAGVTHIIDVLELNAKEAREKAGWLDRRLELRTLALLRASDVYDRLRIALAAGDKDLVARMIELLPAAIRATGFWGVWLSVFRYEESFQRQLATWMPGTHDRGSCRSQHSQRSKQKCR